MATACTLTLCVPPSVRAEIVQRKPSLMHGAAQVVGGVLFELPRTVVEATLDGPPVAGTLVGLFAGTTRAIQTIVGGTIEMATAFDPWGNKTQE